MQTEYSREIIYFSVYRDGVRQRSAGYIGLICRGGSCEIQIFYKSGDGTTPVKPVFLFRDGSVVEGAPLPIKEGVAVQTIQTKRDNILDSGKKTEELEEVYMEGVPDGICAGRVDGKIPSGCNFIEPVIPEQQREEVALTETKETKGTWQFAEFLEYLPELRFPFSGMRKQCCRVMLEELEHLPKGWERTKENQFLLHGYYVYQHLMLGRFFRGKRMQYMLGVPGEWSHREQYMAEHFGFPEFIPAETGGGKRTPFGYWCRTLE